MQTREQHTTPNPPFRVLRRAEVLSRTGLGVSQVYRLMEQGRFPRPVRLSERTVGWVESEVDAWIAERVQARDQDAA